MGVYECMNVGGGCVYFVVGCVFVCILSKEWCLICVWCCWEGAIRHKHAALMCDATYNMYWLSTIYLVGLLVVVVGWSTSICLLNMML